MAGKLGEAGTPDAAAFPGTPDAAALADAAASPLGDDALRGYDMRLLCCGLCTRTTRRPRYHPACPPCGGPLVEGCDGPTRSVLPGFRSRGPRSSEGSPVMAG